MLKAGFRDGFYGLLLLTAFAGLQCSHPAHTEAPSAQELANTLEQIKFEPGKYFRIEQENGRSWFVTPEGKPFLSIGVNHVTWHGCKEKGTNAQPYKDAVLAKYETPENWAKAACQRLKDWEFNTIGAWSMEEVNPHLPRTPILNLTRGYWMSSWKEGGHMPDFFAPAFQQYVEDHAKAVEPHVGDPMIIGYFIDNELPWGPDHQKMPELFDGYVAMPAEAPGKQKFIAFMKKRYETIAAFNKVWKPKLADWAALQEVTELKHRSTKKAKADREDFTLLVARRYFEATTEAIHSRDPGRLVLGSRFMPYSVPKVVVQACGEYRDVISINFYEQLWGAKLYFWWQGSSIDKMPQTMDLSSFYRAGKKPLMVTEFTSRLKKKGQNTWPPPYAIQPVVKTEEKRVARYEKQVMSWIPQPWFVGSHWFEHADQPIGGRTGDGENSIFGLVSINDAPYEEFVKGVTEVHRKATAAHAASQVPAE